MMDAVMKKKSYENHSFFENLPLELTWHILSFLFRSYKNKELDALHHLRQTSRKLCLLVDEIDKKFYNELFEQSKVKQISCGFATSFAVLANGDVYGWGSNCLNQLGMGQIDKSIIPQKLPNLKNIISVVACEDHSLALDQDGKVYAWGENVEGQLGINIKTTKKPPPQQIPNLYNIKMVAVGIAHSLALNHKGELFTWGSNYFGQLGLGDTVNRDIPTQVPNLQNIKYITAGGNHSFAMDCNGRVFTWGLNDYGQLGLGHKHDQAIPQTLPQLPQIKAIKAGLSHSLLLTDDDELFSFGCNKYGQLCLGHNIDQNTPQKIPNLFDISAIDSGNSFSLALNKTGEIHAWGYNHSGELGREIGVSRNTPKTVSSLSNICSIAAGREHNVVLNQQGLLFVWGSNLYSELGLGFNSVPQRHPQAITREYFMSVQPVSERTYNSVHFRQQVQASKSKKRRCIIC